MSENGLKLLINHPEQADSVTGISWCLEEELLEQITEIPHPYLLLIAWHEVRGEVERQMIPLQQMMTFLQFNMSGTHTLHAAIVHPKERHDKSDMVSEVLDMSAFDEYSLHAMDRLGEFRPEWINDCSNSVTAVAHTSLDVVVPKELFAKEPPVWLSAWANRWFSRPPRDQCAFRRRVIMSLTVQPIPVLIQGLVIFVIRLLHWLLGLFLGMRGLRFKPVLHPYGYSKADIWDGEVNQKGSGSSFFVYKSDGRTDRSGWWFFLFPPIPTLLFIVALFIVVVSLEVYFVNLYVLWATSLMMLVIVLGIVSVIMIVGFIVEIGNWLESDERKRTRAKHRRERAQRTQEALERRDEERRKSLLRAQEAELAILGCDRRPEKVSIQNLPRDRRTVLLRYHDLKARVCRPFARG